MSKLEELENKLFMLQMQDTWTHEDYKYEDEALPFALKDIQEEVKDEEFAQRFVDWYFKNWGRCWEDVD